MMKKKIVKKNLKPWIKIVLLVIFIVVFCFSVYKIIIWIQSSKKTKEIVRELEFKTVIQEISTIEEEEVVNPPDDKNNDYWNFIKLPYINVDFDELKDKNKDTVAWIKINNTNINYPVVQTKNNKYYLTHAFDKTYNSAGWLFMDYRNDAKSWGVNTIIYGHSMKNTTMFGTLLKARNKSWYENKDNWVIKMSTPYENTIWQTFSIYEIKSESYYITTSFAANDIQKFFDTITKRSKYDFNVELDEKDKILTLSTCSNSYENERLVIHAKLIKRMER